MNTEKKSPISNPFYPLTQDIINGNASPVSVGKREMNMPSKDANKQLPNSSINANTFYKITHLMVETNGNIPPHSNRQPLKEILSTERIQPNTMLTKDVAAKLPISAPIPLQPTISHTTKLLQEKTMDNTRSKY